MTRPAPSGPAFHRDFVLGAILVVAIAMRVWFLTDGVPFAVGIDEPAIVDRALRILRTGDWNTHIFDYPPLVIYLHALVAIARFLAGAVRGEWISLDQFDIRAVYGAGRFVAAAIGAATVALTYRIGVDVQSRAVGLLAAAQLAVLPMHVRESHFILTDVPVTALTSTAVWMALRASSVRTSRSYAYAGVASGLAAAAKYNGVVAIVAIAAVWIATERRSPDRFRTIAIAAAAAVAAFTVAAPFTILDLPAFLNGFAAQASRFAGTRARGGDPAWLLYIKHLSLAGWWWLPLAGVGAAAALARRTSRTRWLPVIAFAVAYFYVLASHALVFARYALPLVPMICLLAANGVLALVRFAADIAPERAYVRRIALTGAAFALTAAFAYQSVAWLDQLRRKDTRDLAAAWISANLPRGTRLVVENSGPTYLQSAGFQVGSVELVVDHPVDTYARQGFEYLVISSVPGHGDPAYARGGPVVYEVTPSASRWGPAIDVVKIATVTGPEGGSGAQPR